MNLDELKNILGDFVKIQQYDSRKDKWGERAKLLEKYKLEYGDEEALHKEADGFLLKYINDNEVDKLFCLIKKWYA